MKTLTLNFFGIQVLFSCNDQEVHKRISLDFAHFITPNSLVNRNSQVEIRAHLGTIPWEKLPSMVASGQTFNCITYDSPPLRYCDYYKEALCIYHLENESGDIWSNNTNRLHELAYLLILSRTGKLMDLQHVHKIHAFGVCYNEKNLIGMMPMKGGKTTLFLDLMKYPGIKIISDDTPCVDGKGQVWPFPLRAGIEELQKESLEGLDLCLEETYTINRKQYGPKILIPMGALGKEIGSSKKETLLFEGKRKSQGPCEIIPCSKLKIWPALVKNMVVGVGLPIIIEYFLEVGILDFFKKSKILLSRLWSAFFLLIKSKTYIVYLGPDKQNNANTLWKLLERGETEKDSI